MTYRLDPYRSEYDTKTTIGALALPPKYAVQEMFDFPDYDEFEDDDEDIGFCPYVEDMVGAEFNYQTAQTASAAVQTGDHKLGKRHMSAGYKAIRDINNHPATNAALTAAAAVTPWGTIVAGAVKLGLSVAQGVLALVDKFRRSPEERLKRFKKRMSRRTSRVQRRLERKVRKGKKRGSRRASRRLGRLARKAERKTARLQKKARELRGKAKETPPDASPSQKKKLLQAAGKHLGEVMIEASKGNEEARAGLVAVQVLGSKDMRQGMEYLKTVAKGLPAKEAKKLAQMASKVTDKQWKQVMKEAKKVAGNVDIGINFGKVRSVTRKAAKILVKRTNRAAKKRGKIKGLIVPTAGGSIINRKRRGAEQNKKGKPGVLVLKSGKAIPGRWRA